MNMNIDAELSILSTNRRLRVRSLDLGPTLQHKHAHTMSDPESSAAALERYISDALAGLSLDVAPDDVSRTSRAAARSRARSRAKRGCDSGSGLRLERGRREERRGRGMEHGAEGGREPEHMCSLASA
jgi:hypothetical protein